MSPIITIAREYGSAGRMIAKRVSERLGIQYYDNEIIDMVADKLGYDVKTIREKAEQKTSNFMYASQTTQFQMSLNDRIYMMQYQIIRHIAKQAPCIIVNGVADYILEDYDDVLKLFIHAPIHSRVERVKKIYKEEHDDYLKYVKKRDKQRRNYYNYYTEKRWGQINNFDLTINSDLGIDEVVDTIVRLFKEEQ